MALAFIIGASVSADQVSDHPGANTFAGLVAIARRGLSLGKLPVPGAQVLRQLEAYFELMLQWNKAVNLTGAASVKALALEHLPDSLALAEILPANAKLIDVGSGGGLPAIALKILRPDIAVTLVEPRAKRVSFLRTSLRETAITATVVPDRLMEPPQSAFLGQFDAAISRATFAPETWLKLGIPLVRPGGLVVALISDDEIQKQNEGESWRYQLEDGRERLLRLVQRST
jgi:16S rRNA (guanine(527)-N(7))-methyltransferase RsmG